MKHLIKFTIALLPALALMPACDAPEDEAELAALDVEEDEVQANPEIKDGKPNAEEFDIKANINPTAYPPGKCCKAVCTWQAGWQQLPQPYTQADNCNANANYFCGYQHLVDAQWRTCG